MVSSFIDTEARRSALAEGAVLCAQSAELERTAHLTAELFQVSRAAISVTDGDRQRIVAAFGLDERARHGLEPVLAEACIAASRGAAGEPLEGGHASAKVGFVQCQPIRCGEDIVGCLAIADDAPRRLGARGTALMEQLALTCLDQMYLVSIARSLMKANRDRRDDLQSLTAQNKSLKQRLGRIARLGRIGGWTLDTESDQIIWTDELPGGLALQKTPLGSEKVVPLFERSAHEQIRRALRRSIEHGIPLELEQPVRMASGETCWLRIVGEYEPGEGASGRVLGIVQDVSERYRSDEKITYLAHYDAVTGLPNRSLFQDRLQAAVRWAEKSRERLALFVLDLDGFREVNDELGYDGGDAILARLAERLSAAVRACDSVARLGGDRFAIVMNGMDAVGDAMKLAERLLEAASAMVIPGASATLCASIGIALFPADGSSGSQLLRAAETALVRAKRAGGGQYSLFTARMAHLAEHRRHLLSEVRTGLAADQFVVAYQPKIELRTYRLAGFEALIRWSHPERGLLPPAEFWDALSDPALGRDLSNNVLGKVARQLADWRREGVEFGSVAVNVAAGQLRDPGFLGQIRELLARWDLPPSCLSLELTEGVLLGRRSDRTVRAIDAIHNVGLPTELDDFGTGFASLIHLRQFPVDRLKIDRSFVTDLATNPQNETIVRAVVEMAHGLQMEVIAEGVETADVDARLRQIGCDYAQGFFYAKPMLAEEVPAFARSCQASPGRWTPLRLVNSSDSIA